MIRVMVLVMTLGVAQGAIWAQLSDAPEGTHFATTLTSSLDPSMESAPSAMLNPAIAATAAPLPCSQMRTVPVTAVVSTANLPDAPSAHDPLPRHCKFELVLRQTYSPYNFASAAWDATWGQMWGQWPQYGGGMQGWSKRMAASLADVESRRFIQNYVLATALREDPRYFPSDKNGLLPRAWYAATRVLVTRDDYGRNVLNQSEFLGVSLTSSLQNLYYPRPDRTFGGTVNRFLGTLSGDATANILREFTPDLKRMFHKRCPQSIQRLEARMPIPESAKP